MKTKKAPYRMSKFANFGNVEEFRPEVVSRGQILSGGVGEMKVRSRPDIEFGYILYNSDKRFGVTPYGISESDHHVHVPEEWIDVHNQAIDETLLAKLSVASKGEVFYLYVDDDYRVTTWTGRLIGYLSKLGKRQYQFTRSSLVFKGSKTAESTPSDLYAFTCVRSPLGAQAKPPTKEEHRKQVERRRRYAKSK